MKAKFINETLHDEENIFIDEGSNVQLKNGKTLTIIEDTFPGMAGEPTSILIFKVDNEIVSLDEIKILIPTKDLKEIEDWRNQLIDDNYQNAINWTI